jgi:hypothetical protein
MALTSEAGVSDTVRLSAEVLNFGQAMRAPEGTVVFTVDGKRVGAAATLHPGHDPRTGQPAGVASESLPLHLSKGAHTVKAEYIPGGARFLASQSSADGNLKVGAATELASTSGKGSPLEYTGKESKSPAPIEPSGKRFYGSFAEGLTWFSNEDSHPLIVSGKPYISPSITPTTKVPTSPGFIGLKEFNQHYDKVTLYNSTDTLWGHTPHTAEHNNQHGDFGLWLDKEETKGLEASFFYTDSESSSFTSPGNETVGIPYLDLGTGNTGTYIVSQRPITVTNNTFINTTPAVFVHLYTERDTVASTGHAYASLTDRMWGSALNFREELPKVAGLAEDSFSLGFDYLNFAEQLGISSNVAASGVDAINYDKSLGLTRPNYTNSFQSNTYTSDTFTTHNQFFGVQGGLRGKYQWGKVWAEAEGNLALGVMDERLGLDGHTKGTTTTTTAGTKATKLAGIPLTVANGKAATTKTESVDSNYGLFTQAENVGSRSQDAFAAVPSVTLKVGYDITSYCTVFAGYTFYYVSSVLRPVDQVNQKGLTASSLYGQTAELGLKVSF